MMKASVITGISLKQIQTTYRSWAISQRTTSSRREPKLPDGDLRTTDHQQFTLGESDRRGTCPQSAKQNEKKKKKKKKELLFSSSATG
jgi:hypothetical protein